MIRFIILEIGMDDIFLPKVILVMTYIKNLHLIQALEELINPVEMQEKHFLNKKLSNL